MAFFKKREGQAFSKDKELQPFILNGVTPTGTILGTGSFGSVEEVNIFGYKTWQKIRNFLGTIQTSDLCWQEDA